MKIAWSKSCDLSRSSQGGLRDKITGPVMLNVQFCQCMWHNAPIDNTNSYVIDIEFRKIWNERNLISKTFKTNLKHSYNLILLGLSGAFLLDHYRDSAPKTHQGSQWGPMDPERSNSSFALVVHWRSSSDTSYPCQSGESQAVSPTSEILSTPLINGSKAHCQK